MSSILQGKNAIVTGVSKGIGLEIAKLLVNNGVKVAGWSRTAPEFEDSLFTFVKADVGDATSVDQAYEVSVEALGEEIHFLINNAGYGVFGNFEEMSDEEWKGMFDTNVHGIFYATKKVVPQMKAMDFGHIINIGSIAGKTPIKFAVGYAATKHAVTGISHSLFMELRDFGIKVSCIYPGSVNTNFFDNTESFRPSPNMMTPQDIAKSVVDLLDTSANYLPVDLEVRPLRPQGKPEK